VNHVGYVGAAYAVFAAVLAWDVIVPRMKLARVRRAIAQRARRDAARPGRGDASQA
jgi:heme exporter protein D